MKRIALDVGQRFGRLVVIGPEKSKWKCRCDCGNETICSYSNLHTGNTTSCGCLHRERLAERNKTENHSRTHGASYHPLYNIWQKMFARCENVKATQFPRYGGRGINVCERWSNFDTFVADMGPRPSPKHSIDRINNDGPYTPENCRWATHQQQARNRSSNHIITYKGETKTAQEWAETLGLGRLPRIRSIL